MAGFRGSFFRWARARYTGQDNLAQRGGRRGTRVRMTNTATGFYRARVLPTCQSEFRRGAVHPPNKQGKQSPSLAALPNPPCSALPSLPHPSDICYCIHDLHSFRPVMGQSTIAITQDRHIITGQRQRILYIEKVLSGFECALKP